MHWIDKSWIGDLGPQRLGIDDGNGILTPILTRQHSHHTATHAIHHCLQGFGGAAIELFRLGHHKRGRRQRKSPLHDHLVHNTGEAIDIADEVARDGLDR